MVIPLPESRWASRQELGAHEAAVHSVGGLAGLSASQLKTIYQGVVAAGQFQAGGSGAQTASTSQQTRQDAETTGMQPVAGGPALIAGSDMPANITLSPLPPDVGGQTPEVQGLAFATLQDGRLLLADPQTRKIVGVITREEGTGNKAGLAPGSRDPLRHLEESGNANAYTGPHTIR